MSLQEGGNLSGVLLFMGLCIFMISLVNFISRQLGKYPVARAKITHCAKVNFGIVNVAEKEYVGKKAQKICPNYVMIAGLM